MKKFSLQTEVVGLKYFGKQLVLDVDTDDVWEKGEFIGYKALNEFRLQREPTNKYDHNAVQVLMDGQTIGYIPKDDAREVAPLLDKGINIKICQFFIMFKKENNEIVRITLTLEERKAES